MFLFETDLVIKIYMKAIRNTENLRQYKSSFSLIVEQMASPLRTNLMSGS